MRLCILPFVVALFSGFPAVARGKARFRYQVMASHLVEDVEKAASIMIEAKTRAEEELKNL